MRRTLLVITALLASLAAGLLSIVSPAPAAALPQSPSLLRNGGFEDEAAHWQPGNGTEGLNYISYDDATVAHTGRRYLATNTSTPGRSMAQTMGGSYQPGDMFIATVYVRSATGAPVSGTLSLWALGGSPHAGNKNFRAEGTRWVRVDATLVVATPASALKLELYEHTPGATYFVDTAGVAPIWANGGFERDMTDWTPGNGTAGLDYTVYRKPSMAHSGESFLATKTSVPGRSIAQTRSGLFFGGDRYKADVWIRSSTQQRLNGRLAIWGIGGGFDAPAESRATAFSVGPTWTKVSRCRCVWAPFATS